MGLTDKMKRGQTIAVKYETPRRGISKWPPFMFCVINLVQLQFSSQMDLQFAACGLMLP